MSISRCPNCLGEGKVAQVIQIAPHMKRVDIHFEHPLVTCLVCHGSGLRPSWMDDSRHYGHPVGNKEWK